MKRFDEINVLDCPICEGAALLQEENGWCVYVECLDCGAHTTSLPFKDEAGMMAAAQQAADLWNMGKVIASGVGE